MQCNVPLATLDSFLRVDYAFRQFRNGFYVTQTESIRVLMQTSIDELTFLWWYFCFTSNRNMGEQTFIFYFSALFGTESFDAGGLICLANRNFATLGISGLDLFPS